MLLSRSHTSLSSIHLVTIIALIGKRSWIADVGAGNPSQAAVLDRFGHSHLGGQFRQRADARSGSDSLSQHPCRPIILFRILCRERLISPIVMIVPFEARPCGQGWIRTVLPITTGRPRHHLKKRYGSETRTMIVGRINC